MKYAREYIHKIDEDMRDVHNRNALLIKEMQDNFKQYDREINSLNEWKQNALVKIRNYKVRIWLGNCGCVVSDQGTYEADGRHQQGYGRGDQ